LNSLYNSIHYNFLFVNNKFFIKQKTPLTWDGILIKKLGRYTNCKHCIEVDLILMHNQKGSRLRRV
jgi:hypothetical protein